MLKSLKRREGRRGAAAVEFALTLPVILSIMGGAIEFGWYFHESMHMVNAVRQGARAASMTSSDLGPQSVGVAVAQDVWTASGLPGTPSCSATLGTMSALPGTTVTVTCAVDYQPMMGRLIPIPQSVSKFATFQMDPNQS